MIVGQKVVCVDDNFPDWVLKFYNQLPKNGETYIVRDVVIGVNHKGEPGEVCLYLKEFINPCSDAPPDYPERGFNSERFRPLEEVSEEISEEEEMVVVK